MSNKTGNTSRKSTKSKSPKIQEDLIDFDSWFWFQTKDGKLRETQKREIRVFFDLKGLKDKETKSKFSETLKLY